MIERVHPPPGISKDNGSPEGGWIFFKLVKCAQLTIFALLMIACQVQQPNPTPTTLPRSPTSTEEQFVMTALVLEHIYTIDGGEIPFDAPYGVDVSPDGRVYVFDAKNQRVRVYDQYGESLFQWGEPGDGPGQFNSLGFGALAISTNGDAFVIDNGNFRVQKFDSQGRFILAFGVEGEGSGAFTRAIGIAL